MYIHIHTYIHTFRNDFYLVSLQFMASMRIMHMYTHTCTVMIFILSARSLWQVCSFLLHHPSSYTQVRKQNLELLCSCIYAYMCVYILHIYLYKHIPKKSTKLCTFIPPRRVESPQKKKNRIGEIDLFAYCSSGIPTRVRGKGNAELWAAPRLLTTSSKIY
jgi:hypothetical protein